MTDQVAAIDDADLEILHRHRFSNEDVRDIARVVAFFELSYWITNITSTGPNREFYNDGAWKILRSFQFTVSSAYWLTDKCLKQEQ